MSEYLTGKFCYKTDKGIKRDNNEDQALVLVNEKGNVLLMVLDGMGGANKGEIASSLTLSTIKQSFENVDYFTSYFKTKRWIKHTIRNANELVYKESLKSIDNHGMGTTLTLVLIVKNRKYVAQIGDSRLYELKNNHLNQVTTDQSYTEYLIHNGKIKKSEENTHPQRHVLSNALGIYPTVNIDFKMSKYDFNPLLLCSDGLYNNAPFSTIESIMKSDDSVEQKCEQCIKIANANGGSDNIAVIIWEAVR